MDIMKRLKCKLCGYIFEHNLNQGQSPCPECGAVDEWEEVQDQQSSQAGPVETGFEQVIPMDITEAEMSNLADLPHDEAPADDTDPFGKSAETGFEHVVPADFTDAEVAVGGLDADRDESTAIKIDDHAFRRPEETGFDRVIPPDITETVTGAHADPVSDDEAEEGVDSQAFAQPAATGFEQLIPHDFTEGDTSQAVNLENVDVSGEKRSAAFDRPEVTGFDHASLHDFSEGDLLTIASLRVVQSDESLAPEVKRMECPGCGAVVVVVEPGKELPPCPVCNKEVEWKAKQ